MRWSMLLVAVVAAALIAFTLRERGSAADVPKASVEYKVIPVSDLGITGRKGDGVFDYKRATDRLNELAKDGWRFRALITADVPSGGVLLERSR